MRTRTLPLVFTLAASLLSPAQTPAQTRPSAGAPARSQAPARPRTASPAPAQTQGWQQLGRVTGVRVLPSGAEISAGRATYRITALDDSSVRVRFAPNRAFNEGEAWKSWAVLPEALARAAKADVRQTPDAIEIATGKLRVRVHRNPMRISFHDAQGNLISEDDPRRPMVWSNAGFRVWKTMPETESYFGLGDKAGPLNRRNQAFTMWNTDFFGYQEASDPLYKTIPFFIGLKDGRAYGIFLDNTWRTFFDFGKEARDAYSFGADGGELDYYFFYGPHPKQVITSYTALTGRMELPPIATLGYGQCRYSYEPESRVREVVNTFKQKQIPLDTIWLDIDYQDGYAPFTIDRKKFPTFEGMVKDFAATGVRTVLITDLHIAARRNAGYKPYDEGTAGDHFVKNPDGSTYVGVVWPGEAVFPEFTLQRSREWWGTLYQDFVNMGVTGFWNDMNEPAIFRRLSKTMPLETRHRLDGGRTTDHREVHNVFGMLNVKATHDGLLKLRPNARPFVLTRAGYAGNQRYGATWTGDNSSSYNHMRISIPMLLSLGVSGWPNIGSDIGGFQGSPPADLLTRWIELGAFNPLYRNHTTKGTADQEPWVHGPQHEAIRKRYIEERYRLMPYIYTITEEASRTGVPIMRPFFLEYPQLPEADVKIVSGENEPPEIAKVGAMNHEAIFFFGSHLLVAPNIWEFESTGVYLPVGTWYDYWTGAKLDGGKFQPGKKELDQLAVYVRGGSILPRMPVVQNMDQTPTGPLELHVYPGEDCAGSLYQDDGNTFNYRKGEFLRMNFTCEATQSGVRVNIAAAEGSYKPWWNDAAVIVHGIMKRPTQISVGNTAVQNWMHDAQTGAVTVTVPAARSGSSVNIAF